MKNEFNHQPKHHHPDDPIEERQHFPPHHPHHQYGIGSNLVSLEPYKHLFNMLFKSSTDTAWVLRESTTEGPDHVQVRNSIILVQVAQVLDKLNISTGQITIPVIGSSPRDYEFEYPIGLPEDILEIIQSENQDDVLSWISKGPVHEVSMDLILMNALAAINARLTDKTEDHENKAE
jgi:hypothetical protein